MISQPSDRLENRLVPDERLTAVYGARLSSGSAWEPASVGVTDRRLLCVSEDGAVVTVGHDAISAIRSRPRKSVTYRGNDYRLLAGAGGLAAALGALGVVAVASSLLAPLLLLVAVGGLVAAEYLRRSAGGVELSPTVEATDGGGYDGDDRRRDGGRGADVARALRRYKRRALAYADDHPTELLITASGHAAVLSFVGLVVLGPTVAVSALVAVIVGGLALADYAWRHREDLDGVELVRRRETEVTIATEDGRTVDLRIDATAEIGQDLDRLVFSDAADPLPVVSSQS